MMMDTKCLILVGLQDSPDTESKDENEEAKVSDTISSHENMERRTTRKIRKHLVLQVRTLHLLILLQGTMQFSILQYLILQVNYPSTPGMRGTTDVKKMLPSRTEERRGTKDPPKLKLTQLILMSFLRIYIYM